MDWLFGIGALVAGIAVLYFTIDRKYKLAYLLEFVVWIIIVVNSGLGGFDFAKPATYLTIGIFIAFIGRVILFIRKK